MLAPLAPLDVSALPTPPVLPLEPPTEEVPDAVLFPPPCVLPATPPDEEPELPLASLLEAAPPELVELPDPEPEGEAPPLAVLVPESRDEQPAAIAEATTQTSRFRSTVTPGQRQVSNPGPAYSSRPPRANSQHRVEREQAEQSRAWSARAHCAKWISRSELATSEA